MNYSKKGVRAKQKTLNSKSQKWGRKIALTCVKVMLAAVVGIGICGVAAGIGVFRGILSSTPTIRLSDVVAVGEATIVYDREGNEIDQYVSTNSNRLSVGMDVSISITVLISRVLSVPVISFLRPVVKKPRVPVPLPSSF